MLENSINKTANAKKKQILFTIALILMLAVSTFMTSAHAQTGTAANPLQVPTNAFLSVEPNPVGVNQKLAVTLWLAQIPPFNGAGDGQPYQGYTFTVTKPDGTTQTFGPYGSDYIGTFYTTFTPTTTGKYSFQFNYAGEIKNVSSTLIGASATTIIAQYLPSQSIVQTVTVQQQQIGFYPNTPMPLPSNYWQAPVIATNYLWTDLSGNWLGVPMQNGMGYNNNPYVSGAYNPYTTAPLTPHIIWNTPLAFAGLVGGEWGYGDYYTGLSYTPRWGNNGVIMNGYLYYNLPTADYGSNGEGTVCVSLATGKQVWYQNITISLGQLLDYETMNQNGIIPYLWQTGSTYRLFDPMTGFLLSSFTGGLSGRIMYDAQGDMLVYVLTNTNLVLWNSTLCIINNGGQIYTQANSVGPEWRPPVGSFPWSKGIVWNVTTPNLFGQTLVEMNPHVLIVTFANTTGVPPSAVIMGLSPIDGHQMWNYTIPNFFTGRAQYNFSPIDPKLNIYAYFNQATTEWSGYNALTGQKIWGPDAPYNYSWGFYSQSYAGCGVTSPTVANGVVYSTSYAGITAIDMATGKILWFFQTPSAGFETPYGVYPFYGGPTVAGGVVYAGVDEHSPNTQLYQGYDLYAVNATTGTALWNLPIGYSCNPMISNGILVDYSNYDGNVYAVGKGKTATTVSASPVTLASKSPTTIQGTVTDQSSGNTCLGIPAAGTPAVSDDSMTEWMNYLYMQQPKPNNAVGVPVHLTAFDPNNNTEDLGYVTSDANGNYAIQWTPPVPGVYKIIATFEGSNSYFQSSSETAITVSPAVSASVVVITPPPATAAPTNPTTNPPSSPAVTVAPTPSPIIAPPTSPTPTATYIAIGAVVIAVVVIAAALILRRRK